MNAQAAEPKPVRMVFELARADNPRLYDELVRFQQGAKRVNRLRVLAYDGLLVQHGVLALGVGRAMGAPAVQTEVPADAVLTNALFAPSLVE